MTEEPPVKKLIIMEDNIMAITGIGSNYNNNVYESTYVAQKSEGVKKAETKGTDAAGVTADIENGTVSDYYSYLQKNYDCISKGNVSISGQYLQQCAGDSSKAKELEDFLKKIPELEKQGYEELSARNKALGGTVTYYQQTWMINKDGSIQSTVYSVTETGMTNAERMKKNMDERLEKQKEKKEEEEKVKEQKDKETEQEERIAGGTDEGSVSDTKEHEITLKYVEAESEMEVDVMVQKEKLENAYYRNSIQRNQQETYDDVVQRKEQLKKVSFNDYGYEIQKRAAQQNEAADRSVLSINDKANSYVKAYAELYDEIVQGYENGTREIYTADENGTHKLTKDEELSALDAAYKKTVDSFVTMEETNQRARTIIGEEAEKIVKISRRETTEAVFLKEQKERGTDQVPENLNEKMLSAVASFKEKYAAFNPNAGTLSQLLADIKISQ